MYWFSSTIVNNKVIYIDFFLFFFYCYSTQFLPTRNLYFYITSSNIHLIFGFNTCNLFILAMESWISLEFHAGFYKQKNKYKMMLTFSSKHIKIHLIEMNYGEKWKTIITTKCFFFHISLKLTWKLYKFTNSNVKHRFR